MVTRKCRLILLPCALLSPLALCGDETLFSRREFAGQTYIQSERVVFTPNAEVTATEWMIASGGGASSLAYRIIPRNDDPWYPYLQQYDQWNDALHPPLELDPVFGAYTHIVDAERLGGNACICWSRAGEMAVQVFSSDGTPFSDAFCPALELGGYYQSLGIELESERLVFRSDGTYESDEVVLQGVFLIATDWGGITSSGVIVIAANDGNPRNMGVSTAELSDRSTAVVWTEGAWWEGQTSRILYRRLLSDLSLTAPVELVPGPIVGTGRVRELVSGELLLVYAREADWQLHAQRFMPDGTPTTEPQVLPYNIQSSSIWFDIARDGRLIVFSQVSGSMFAQVFGTDFEPQGGPFPLSILSNARPNGLIRQPVQFDDNGSIAWLFLTNSPARIWHARVTPFFPGDMNRDGLLNNFDIDPFVFALSNLPGYSTQYDIPEDAAAIIGDVNEDGVFNNFDIDPFVMLLAGE